MVPPVPRAARSGKRAPQPAQVGQIGTKLKTREHQPANRAAKASTSVGVRAASPQQRLQADSSMRADNTAA